MPGAGVPAAPNPVGRPSNDPDQQQQRAERSLATKRLDAITPNRAKDHKLHVFRTDGNGRSRGKAVLVLLASDIENYLQSAPPDARDEALDNLITERFPENKPDGVYKCQWYDQQNHPVMTPPPWEIQIGEGDGSEDGFIDEEEEEELPAQMPVQPTFAQPTNPYPPAPPAMDMATMGSAIRAERADADKRNTDMTAMMLGFSNTMMQMMTAQQQNAQMMTVQAEERERARRAEFRTTLLTAIPLILPVITQLFARPAQNGPSPELTMLLELVKGLATNKDSGAMMMEKMITFQTEMTKAQLQLQAQGATSAVQMQAEASALVFKNLMTTMKEMSENKPSGGDGGGIMDVIGKLAGPFLATMAANAQNQQAAAPEMPAAAAPAAPRMARTQSEKQAPPPAAEAPQRRVVRRARPEAPTAAAPAAPPQVDPSKYPEPRRIVGAMRAVRGLSLGDPAPSERWNVVAWAANMLPPSIIEPVKAQNRDKVMEAALPVVMNDATLLQWITDSENATFLEEFLQDVRLYVLNQVTEDAAEASLIKGGQFVQRRKQQASQAAQADQAAVAKHHNPPESGEAVKPAVSASVVPQGGDNITTPDAPVVPATPATPPQDAPSRTSSTKTPPPAPQG